MASANIGLDSEKSVSRHVPIFSLKELQSGVGRAEFQECLVRKGIFYLKDHGIPESEHEQARSVVMDFFQNASDEEKATVVTGVPILRRGYSKLEAESVAQVTKKGNYTDYAMCYSMGVSNNLFPSTHFEQIWTNYFDRMHAVARETARVALDAVGVEAEADLLDCDPVLRCRLYPEVPEQRCAEKEPLRMAPHYDLSIVTLIYQTPCANGFVSLQCNVEGQSVELPSLPGTLVVMCGAVGTLMSRGQFLAPIHQVLAPNSSQRIGSSRNSNVFFLRPNADFEFSVPMAKECGFDVSLNGERATFRDWIGGNYTDMHTKWNKVNSRQRD